MTREPWVPHAQPFSVAKSTPEPGFELPTLSPYPSGRALDWHMVVPGFEPRYPHFFALGTNVVQTPPPAHRRLIQHIVFNTCKIVSPKLVASKHVAALIPRGLPTCPFDCPGVPVCCGISPRQLRCSSMYFRCVIECSLVWAAPSLAAAVPLGAPWCLPWSWLCLCVFPCWVRLVGGGFPLFPPLVPVVAGLGVKIMISYNRVVSRFHL